MRNNKNGKKHQRGSSPSTQEVDVTSGNWGVDWIPSDAQIHRDEVNLKAAEQASDQKPHSESRVRNNLRVRKKKEKAVT